MSGSSLDSPKSASSRSDEDDKAGPSVAHQSSDESTTSDGVLVEIPGQDRSDGDRTEDAGREEMFVDAPDELGGRGVDLSESMAMVDLGESSEDRSSPEHLERVWSECRKYKEEREVFGRQIAGLRRQLKDIMDRRVVEQLGLMESGGGGEQDQDFSSLTPLHKMIGDCSKFVDHLQGIAGTKLQAEAMIRELNTVLYVKDQKIEDLNSSVSESAVYQDIIVSYLHSVQSVWMDAFLYEVQQIRQCLAECRPDIMVSHCNDPSFVFSMVCEQLLDGKRKESNFLEIVSRLEEENRKMAEEIERMKDGLEEANTETSKIKTDLEQAENRLAAAKEKLGIAVTKGKSLVQHRDALKQSLAEKTSELEKCVLELQQKSISLEIMEANAEGLKQSLAERTSELEKCFVDLQQKSDDLRTMEASTEELKQALIEKSDKLEMCLQELQQKSDALVAAHALSEEMSNTQSLVHSLQGSLSHKENVLHEIEEIMSQIETSQDLLSLDAIDRVRWLVDQKQISEALLVERHKMKDAISSIDLPEVIRSSELESQIHWLIESFSRYRDDIVKVQGELATAHAGAVTRESELSELQKEIDLLAASLSEEKKKNESLQDLLEDFRSKYEDMVEKFTLVSSEKDRLSKVLLELSESTLEGQSSCDVDIMIENCVREVREKVAISSIGTEHLERLQSLLYVSYQELMLCEKMLEEEINNNSVMMETSNNLERASVEIIALRDEKSSLQKELERVEEKASLLREKLSMAVKKGKGLVQEREGFKVSLDEKNAEIGKLKSDLQLQDSTIAEYEEKIKNLSGYPEQAQKLEADILLLKDQKDQIETFLHESNDRLQILIESIEHIVLPTDTSFDGPLEKVSLIAEYIHVFETAKTYAEKELEKVKEEATLHASSLSDAFVAIKSLEDKLSEAKKLNSLIVEEKNDIQIGKTSAEYELEKMKEEISIQASKLEHACATITSLEEALLKANEKVTLLDAEKMGLESKTNNEIIILNAKLADCMEELAGVHGCLENQSANLANHLEHLQTLMKNDGLLSLMTNDFQEKIVGLRNMGSLLQDMHNQIEAKGFATHPHLKEHSRALLSLPMFEDFVKGRAVNSDTSTEDFNSSLSITKIVESFDAQAKLVGDSFKGLSRFMDEHIMLVSQALRAAIDENFQILELNGSLKLEVATLEDEMQVKEAKVIALQKDLALLLSACNDATQELQSQLQGVLDSKRSSEQHLSNLDLISKEATGGEGEEQTAVDYTRAAESLLFAARRVKVEFHQLEKANRGLMTLTDELENKFKQAELTAENAIQDRHLIQERLSELEVDLAALRNVCSELRVQIKDHESKEDMDIWKEREAELLSLQSSLSVKERGISDKSLSEDQVEVLIGKVNKIENLLKEFQTTDQEIHFSSPIEKLDHLLDKVSVLKRTLDSLTYEKDDMQLIIASHVREIEHLKNDIETISDNHQDIESKKTELTEVTLGLERIIRRLGENETIEDKEAVSVKELLFELERLVTAVSVESDNSKSRMQELGAKLQAKEKVVDDLSAKVKSLEDSFHARVLHSEAVNERTLFEAPPILGSEISELEDAGPLVKSSISPMPAAAHVRTMRKGSADHLALNIDSESERLITPRETDEKGHVFKSLNTSGLIPKQGKLIADRVDGIWVSGGRILMSRPGARLGLIAYWLLLHIWVLGTIL